MNKVLVAENLEVGQPRPHPEPDEDPGERPSQEGVLESLPVARGSLGGGVRSQASLMQEVDMVMSRKRKLSLAGNTARIQRHGRSRSRS